MPSKTTWNMASYLPELIMSSNCGLLEMRFMVRPLAQKGIAELEELIGQSGVDPSLVKDVIEELRFRSTSRATRLLAELEGRKGTSRPDRAKRKSAIDRTHSRKASSIPEMSESASVTDATSSRTLEEAYALLRETFTEDSEILAKWGMTSSMPEDLRKLVFNHWSRRISSKSDEFGRNDKRLHADLDQLRKNEENKERHE